MTYYWINDNINVHAYHKHIKIIKQGQTLTLLRPKWRETRRKTNCTTHRTKTRKQSKLYFDNC